MKKTIWIINQYASLPSTGMGGRHRDLARELARRGHKVTLVSARWTHLVRDNEAAEAAPDEEMFEGFRFVRVSVGRYAHAQDKKRILNWFSFAWKLTGLAGTLNERPDVVLYSSPSLIGFLGAERLARKYSARLVFEVRDIWPLTFSELGGYSHRHPFIRFLQWIEDRAYRNSDFVISNLPGAVDHMIGRGLSSEKFRWIPNGFSKADVDQCLPLPSEVYSKLPKDTFNICYTGTIGTANALHTLVKAASLLKDEPSISFTIVGQGSEKEALKESVTRLGLSNVFFVDPVPKNMVQSILQECDVCYLGLTGDSLFRFGVSPNKLFDYLVSGKPIIYGIDSGDYRPVEEFGAGLQIKPEDPVGLANAVKELKSRSKRELSEMGGNGRKAAFEYHEYGMLAKKLENVLLKNQID
ncbi:Glycosyl transferase group 1 [Alloalcanivorax dieselolei B5]|uniref:Glycosyl transferase group 1 n=2 Tax=Alloalcanivorax dieselolei TaxID=285091 RepID=K0CEG9_ALCDB|nr:glycosyltransferase family 4 protein [Alloalcanivorax dieselolei]AFT69996.1 Glycosyl transferase group 1 [Alloalcanivorax dieselolei B5]